MSELAKKHCVPCRGGVPPLTKAEIRPLAAEVPAWKVVDGRKLRRELRFRDFATALRFVDRIGALAEEEGHHPDLCLGYGRVDLEVWTHKVNGLTESDFVFAAKADELAETAEGRTG